MITHIGIENLIHNHTTHHKAHACAQGKNKANGGAAAPIILLHLNEAIARIHNDVLGQIVAKPFGHSLRISPRPQPNQAQLNAARRRIGQQAQKGFTAGEQVAIGAKGRAHGKEASHPQPLAGDFTFHRAALAKPAGHRAEFIAGALIKQHPAFLGEQGSLGREGRVIEQGITGLKAQGQDRAGAAGFRIAPEQQIPMHRRDALHLGIGQGLHQPAARKAGHAD